MSDWLSPKKLIPDLVCGVWLLAVAVMYLGSQLLTALARAMAVGG